MKKFIMFPSPYGEVGFDQSSVRKKPVTCISFPSPYGEVGFDLLFWKFNVGDKLIVSVPLRGSWF